MAVHIYFGVPGSGKTTHAAKIVYKNLKKGIPTFCNVNIRGAIKINASDIGKIMLTDGDLIIDEASIEYNNRNFKSLPKETIQWFKLARHYGIRNIYVYSQSYDDMDITLRRLSDVMYIVKKTFIPGLIVTRQISRKIGINQETHQIEDQFFFQLFHMSFCFGPRYWKLFDSWECPSLPRTRLKIMGYEIYPIHPDVLKLIPKNMKIKKGVNQRENKNQVKVASDDVLSSSKDDYGMQKRGRV